MIVYHGSYEDLKEIDLSKAKPNKDFGKGFYATNLQKQAELWAKQKGIEKQTNGVVSSFKFNESAYYDDDYKILRFDGYTKEWFRFIVANRKNESPENIHDYDIVEGPVADDFTFGEFDRYLAGVIKEDEFFERLKFKRDISHQICFCTNKSLDTIERINLKAYFKIEDIGASVTAFLEMNDKISEQKALDLYYESETYKKVSDETTELYNKSWQEIYDMLKKEIELNKKY